METRSEYKTKQKQLVLSCIKQMGDRHFTADDISDKLTASGHHVGKTTVYRHLDKFLCEGEVRKYIIDDKSSACYQYCGEKACEHFHLKCTKCGGLIHADCTFLDKLSEHIGAEHGFTVDRSKTVFYGECEKCSESAAKKCPCGCHG